MSKISLIIESEYKRRVRKKSFIVMTILSPLLMILICCLPILIEQFNDHELRQVTIVDHTGLYGNVFTNNDEYQFTYLDEVTTQEQMRNNEEPYAYIVISDNLLNDPMAMTIFSHKQTTSGFTNMVTEQMEEYLYNEKISSYEIPNLQEIINESNIQLYVSSVKFDEEGDVQTSADLASLVGILSTFLIYMFLFMYGGMVMNSVMQEKSNRIVEVMVSSVKPFELMIGKIISIGLVGLTQIGIWLLLIVGVLLGASLYYGIPLFSVSEAQLMSQLQAQAAGDPAMTGAGVGTLTAVQGVFVALSSINFTQILICLVIYFIGGYVLYASFFAAIGSAIDNDSDSNQFMLPVTIIILFAFYVGIFSAENPEGGMAWWCSMIPLTSPIVMMVRIPFGVPAWEIILSIIILFASAVGMIWIASRIYRVGILMYGKKVSYKELFKWIKYKA